MHDANEAIEMNSPDIIERERRFERLRLELKRQFKTLDLNGDGYVDKNEIIQYLIKLTEDNGQAAKLNDEEL